MKATELTPDAYNYALNIWISSQLESANVYYQDTLKQFSHFFDVKVNIGYSYGNPFVISVNEDERYSERHGYRLANDLHEAYKTLCEVRHKVYQMGKKFIVSHVNITEAKSDCPLTGCYTDYAILEPLIQFLEHPSYDMDMETLTKQCADALLQQYSEECDSYNEEMFLEDCELFGFEFDEDGGRIQ